MLEFCFVSLLRFMFEQKYYLIAFQIPILEMFCVKAHPLSVTCYAELLNEFPKNGFNCVSKVIYFGNKQKAENDRA